MLTTETNGEIQKNSLLRLPNELLLMIIDDDSLEWEDRLNIHHTSSLLFKLTITQVFQQGNFFRHACLHADIELMEACVKHNAAPTNKLWPSYRFEWSADSVSQRWETPLNFLSKGLQEGNMSVVQYIKAAEWLSEKGYRMHKFRQAPSISPDLLVKLSTTSDGDKHQDICRYIEVLVNKGVKVPYESLLTEHYERQSALIKAASREEYCLSFSADRSRGVIHMLMESAYPPFLLEHYLLKTLLEDQLLAFKFRTSAEHAESTPIDHVLRILFDDLMAPWKFKGGHSYIADTFKAKIEVLAKYGGINCNEKHVLKDILRALRNIERRSRKEGGLDFKRDGVWCWRKLCISICYLTRGYATVNKINLRDEREAKSESFMHEFICPTAWYPPEELARHRTNMMRCGAFSGKEGYVYHPVQDCTEADWVNMPLEAWDILLHNGTGGVYRLKGGNLLFGLPLPTI
ncbi:hypothetical protein F53441_14209 [Fusarium austroafricanum]|uniref:Uncharacterized protein n=1 Tax=Fusarium austroafricanum TaxID=2364996 RepID=A0A8H4JGG1_9HYPO|nr:hypothetical protein F53441_14209 [Fusarium austroafricanum]